MINLTLVERAAPPPLHPTRVWTCSHLRCFRSRARGVTQLLSQVYLEFVSHHMLCQWQFGALPQVSEKSPGLSFWLCWVGQGPSGQLSPAVPVPHGVNSVSAQGEPSVCVSTSHTLTLTHSRHFCTEWALQNIFELIRRWLMGLKLQLLGIPLLYLNFLFAYVQKVNNLIYSLVHL